MEIRVVGMAVEFFRVLRPAGGMVAIGPAGTVVSVDGTVFRSSVFVSRGWFWV